MSVYHMSVYTPQRSAFFNHLPHLTYHTPVTHIYPHAPRNRRRCIQIHHRTHQTVSQKLNYSNGEYAVTHKQSPNGQANIQRIEKIKNLTLDYTGPLAKYPLFRAQQLQRFNIREEAVQPNNALPAPATKASVDAPQTDKTPQTQPKESSPARETSLWQDLWTALTN